MHGLGLSRWLVDVCEALRMTSAFPVQEQSIPIILQGKNIIASAATGQGKTAAYVLPLLEIFHREDRPSWFSLTLAPTRELALQVREQVCVFGAGVSVRVVALIGGESVSEQKNCLIERPCHFIVATPGRLFDIIDGDAVLAKRFKRVQALCLDECDKLLDPSMDKALSIILGALRLTSIRRLCFSATLTPETVAALKSRLELGDDTPFLDLARSVSTGEANEASILTPDCLTQQKYVCSATPQYHLLNYLLSKESESPFTGKRGIIFCKTIEECETLCRALRKLKKSITSLHSLQTQTERRDSIEKFKTEAVTILIATNVAARGLDLPRVDWVINLDVPREVDDYVHRVGRCARAGKPGIALTFVVQVLRHKQAALDVNTKRLAAIEAAIGQKIKSFRIDEEKAIMFPNRINKAVARAKYDLEEEQFADRLVARQKRRREN